MRSDFTRKYVFIYVEFFIYIEFFQRYRKIKILLFISMVEQQIESLVDIEWLFLLDNKCDNICQ